MSNEYNTVPAPPVGQPLYQAVPPPTGQPVVQAPPTGEPVLPATPPTQVSPFTSPTSTAQLPGDAVLPPPTGQPKLYSNESGLKNGINKCPRCGSSDMQLDMSTGLLHCNYCHCEFSEISDGIDGDIALLSGMHIGSGATDITFDAADIITLKCSACGAEVVLDTNEAPQARCHWCRNMLSLNQQVPNGAVPDAVMPFRITKEEARSRIEQFVGKRRFFAHPQFKREFSTENIMGVYLPYMVVDVNAQADFQGQGEHLVRRYTVGSGKDKQTRYDADLYAVGRTFNLHIDDLTVEASADKLEQTTALNSNNIINSILPYPLKETVRFNANYLRGFTSEKRSVNRDQIAGLAGAQVRDVARWQAKRQAPFYDRGICWTTQNVEVKGELWKTVYLPVWLYSFLQIKAGGQKFLHYVAVNACTGETMGSVPIHLPKLVAVSAVIEIVGVVLGVSAAALLFLFG